jgi:hypothetical protein
MSATLSQCETEATALSALISSLSGQTGQAATNIRTEIQTAAVALQADLLYVVNAGTEAAQAAAGTSFDALITWIASTDANLRQKCIDAATSVQGLIQLVRQLMAWASILGTTGWTTGPETAAQKLITYLATYRSITGL